MKVQHKTTWQESASTATFDSLSKNIDTEVAVVGGGITGLLSAYSLAREGKKVVLLEKDTLCKGATMMTTAFVTCVIDTDFSDLSSTYGAMNAKKIVRSHKEALDYIEKIIKDEKIECDFLRCSNYIYANEEKDMESLKEELKAMKELGVEAKLVENGGKLGFKNEGYVEVLGQAKFDPLKFLSALSKILAKTGVVIFENTEVKEIEKKGERLVIKTSKFEVNSDWAISVTYSPLNQPLNLYFKKAMYVSYVFELDVRNSNLQEGIFEDLENPYHYMRVDKADGKQRVIVGGEDHRHDVPVDETRNFNALKEYVDSIIPPTNYSIVKKWTGPILEPIDGIAYIGTLHDKVLTAFAFSGNGMTYSAISAKIFADQIQGRKNDFEDVYRVDRLPSFKSLMTKGRDFGGELIGGAVKNVFSQSKDPSPKTE